MKLNVSYAIELLTKMNPDESILFWYRTIDDYPDITKTCWGNLEDDSGVLEEVIDEYISGWIEEDEDQSGKDW